MNVKSHRKTKRIYLDFLKSNNIPYSITYTNRTFKVVSEHGTRVFVSGEISKRGLGFMQKVKTHIKGNIESLSHLNKNYKDLGLKRMVFSDMKDGIHTGIREIDIDRAYWTSAWKLSIISSEIYQEGLNGKFKKVELLACLGALAKEKRRRYFDGYKLSRSEVIEDSSETKFLWDAISFYVDVAMSNCIHKLKNDFLFYWTDAAFIRYTKSSEKKVSQVLKEVGFSCKNIEIEYLNNDTKNKKIIVYTKKNKSNAENPIVDNRGLFGRVFVLVNDSAPNQIVEKIKSGFVNYNKNNHGE